MQEHEQSKDKRKDKETSPKVREDGASTFKTTTKAPFPSALVTPSFHLFGKKGP